jgi:sulfite exporter TauE/SafE
MLGLGLAGSAHCGLMCGAVFATCAQGGGRGFARTAWLHAGRTAGYATLGAAGGAVGQVLDRGTAAMALPRVAAVLAGIVMIGLALEQLGVLGKLTGQSSWRPGEWLAGALRVPGATGGFAVGAALGLLPCGMLYAAVAASAGSADPWRGAWMMALFALGGAIPLAALGQALKVAWRQGAGTWLNRAAAALVLVMGVMTLGSRVDSPAGTGTPRDAASVRRSHAASHMHHGGSP